MRLLKRLGGAGNQLGPHRRESVGLRGHNRLSQVGYEGDSGGLLLILFIVLQRSLLSSFRLRGVA